MATSTTHSGADRAQRSAGALQGILLLAGSCMPVLGSVLLTPILPQLSAHFAGEPGADVLVPMIVAIPALMIAIFAPFAGQVVDRIGRKPLLLVAMIAYAIAGTAPAWMEGLTGILLSRVLVGVCEAAIMTVCTALIVDYFHEERRRTKYLGLQTVTTTLAATVFIALGGALGTGGWHAPFWVYSVSIVIAIPMFFALWEPRRGDEVGDAAVPERVRIPWRRIRIRLLVSLFAGFSFYVMVIEVSYLVVATGVDAQDTRTIGLVSAVASLATAIAGFTFSRLGGLRPGALLPLAFGLQAVGMILVWVLPGFAGVVIGSIVASLGSGFLLPSLLTWVVAPTSFDERGRVTGLWTASFFLGQFLTPILVGALTAAIGGLEPVVGVVGLCAAAVGAALFATRRRSTRA
ncbi:MFS transporter [Microbacterium karelineae]|uniref:MFS transporter n=1 Tax=Microbacterium karelineae TaxID=2654283 RepID=UPI0012E9C500|nr:MFS transporter [Microbacterium karelineae]